jgi:hypothetical protein
LHHQSGPHPLVSHIRGCSCMLEGVRHAVINSCMLWHASTYNMQHVPWRRPWGLHPLRAHARTHTRSACSCMLCVTCCCQSQHTARAQARASNEFPTPGRQGQPPPHTHTHTRTPYTHAAGAAACWRVFGILLPTKQTALAPVKTSTPLARHKQPIRPPPPNTHTVKTVTPPALVGSLTEPAGRQLCSSQSTVAAAQAGGP